MRAPSDYVRLRLDEGQTMPLVSEPKGDSTSNSLLSWIEAERQWIAERIETHGAVLVRGFEAVSDAVRAVIWKNTVYPTWEVGNVLAIDNIVVAHGRFPSWAERRIMACVA